MSQFNHCLDIALATITTLTGLQFKNTNKI